MRRWNEAWARCPMLIAGWPINSSLEFSASERSSISGLPR
jgi:hypothetical protein